MARNRRKGAGPLARLIPVAIFFLVLSRCNGALESNEPVIFPEPAVDVIEAGQRISNGGVEAIVDVCAPEMMIVRVFNDEAAPVDVRVSASVRFFEPVDGLDGVGAGTGLQDIEPGESAEWVYEPTIGGEPIEASNCILTSLTVNR